MPSISLAELEPNAAAAAGLLKSIANKSRLQVLCQLAVHGEASVSALSETVGLGQSALSQHLARLRRDGLVVCRRDAQTIYYRVSDTRALRVLETLQGIFCP